MPRSVTTGLYDFDPYGNNPDNRVRSEQQVLNTPGRDDFYFIIPQAAPFFVKSLEVRDKETGRLYVENTDYVIGHWFVEAMNETGRPIAGSIRFLDRSIGGIVVLDYQTLGGEWGFDDQAILKELSNKALNPLTRAWAEIDGLPATFPPIPHDQRVDDLVGFTDIVAAVGDIVQAIKDSDEGKFGDHIADKGNPHGVTKVQVGLGNVRNFPIAGEGDARDMSSNTRYMTPLMVGYSLDEFYNDRIAQFFDGTVTNATGVTKAQIGLGDVQDYPIASQQEALDGLRNDRYMTPLRVKEALGGITVGEIGGHVSDTNNPHQVTASQTGAPTIEDLNDVIASFSDYLLVDETAYNSTRFGGMTVPEYMNFVLEGTAANSEKLEGLSVNDINDLFDESFASQYTYYPSFEDKASATVDHRWLEIFTRETGGRTTSLLLNVPGDGAYTALIQITIPPSGGVFYLHVLNDVYPSVSFSVREIDADTHSICVDILGMSGAVTVTLLQAMDYNHSVAPTDGFVIYDHDTDFTLLSPVNTLLQEVETTVNENKDYHDQQMDSLLDGLINEFDNATTAL